MAGILARETVVQRKQNMEWRQKWGWSKKKFTDDLLKIVSNPSMTHTFTNSTGNTLVQKCMLGFWAPILNQGPCEHEEEEGDGVRPSPPLLLINLNMRGKSLTTLE